MSRHDTRGLIRAWRDARKSGAALVLATVTHTSGSTYRKAGARMLIGDQGVIAGVVGGGCFDQDLVERSTQVQRAGLGTTVVYDLRSPDEAVWGLGLGCEGLVELFLQPLNDEADDGHPIHCLAAALARGGGRVATLTDGDRPGHTWLLADDEQPPSAGVFVDTVRPPLHLAVCGAGVDAVPLVAMAAQLGWQVSVLDHRPAYLEPSRFPAACQLLHFTGRLPAAAEDADAVVVMSHHLATDRRYLQQWADRACRYIGVLGPAARRQRLLRELGGHAAALRDRLRGPVGLELGGELPEEVALSMLAEIQAWRHDRPGLPLTPVERPERALVSTR